MKKFLRFALFVFLITTILFVKLTLVFASEFSTVYVRLDRLKANTTLSGTVCATPSSSGAGTESKIEVSFPIDFTISTNTSNWTTNTLNLPSGATSWPGIGATATSVSGNYVTFASSDLTSSSNLYCFNFTSSLSSTGGTGSSPATVITKNSSNTAIDSATYFLAIVANDQITVTAGAPAKISDLPLSFVSTTPGTQFPQETQISYQITYGSNAYSPIPLIIQAEWSQGTLQGNPTPSVDILDYVSGSASNAYNATPPIIDTVNRTITWTIASFPAQTTGQTLTFTLKTNSSYTGTTFVNFTVSARASSGSTVVPDIDISQSYLFDTGLVPTSTPAPTPSSNTTGTITPTPTTIEKNLEFTNISIRKLTRSEAQIYVATNKNASITIQYGKSISSLSNSIKSLTKRLDNLISLAELEPDTVYYFRITATDENGKTIISDFYTFKTALISELPKINLDSLIVTSQNNILVNPGASQIKKNFIVIPTSTIFELQFALVKHDFVKSMQAIVRNKQVLGLNTIEEADAYSNFVNLTETTPGIFTGKLTSFDTTGLYEIYVKIADYSGNITEEKLADLKIVKKLTVLEKGSNNPVENTRVFLSIYNSKLRLFEKISSQILPIKNPVFSEPDGTLNLVLPQGKYRGEISNIGYKSQTVEFTIGPEGNENYPTIYLEKEPFNIVNVILYYYSTISDAFKSNQMYITSLSQSFRLFNLVSAVTILLLIVFTFLAFSARTHISPFTLPSYAIFGLKLMFLKSKRKNYILGKVTDENEKAVSRANVYLIDTKLDKTIEHAKTNKNGVFYFDKQKSDLYKISVTKKGFIASPSINLTNDTNKDVVIKINKEAETQKSGINNLYFVLENLTGFLFEQLLLLSLIFEVLFYSAFGIVKIAPFMAISILNLGLWFFYLKHSKSVKI